MSKSDGIRLFICGDFYAKSISNIIISPRLQNAITRSDLRICNFEGPVRTNMTEKIAKSGVSLAQDPSVPSYLETSGFNVFLFGNNHFMDFGERAARNTLMSFKKASTLVGAGSPSEAYAVKRIHIKGKSIGFLSLVQHEFGVIESASDKNGFGTAWINCPNIKDIIIKEKEDLDYLILFPHAGIEHIDAPLPEWRELYRSFIDWGVDSVIASHPHVPQGWESYKGHPIFYSLGNFYFDTLKGGKWWSKGLAVELLLDDGISVNIINTLFTKQSIDIDDSEEASNHNKYLCSLLYNNDIYEKYIMSKSKQSLNNYKFELLRSINGVSFDLGFKNFIKSVLSALFKKGNINTLLNILQCESHRWMLERGIKNHLNKIDK